MPVPGTYGGLTPDMLAWMQTVQETWLPDRCDVLRPDMVENAAGGRSFNWIKVAAGVPCEAQARVLRQLVEHVGGGEVEAAVRWNVNLPTGVDVRVTDRLLVTNGQTGAQMTLEVNGLLNPDSWSTSNVVECLRMQ